MTASPHHTAAVIRSYHNPSVLPSVRNLLDIGVGRVVVIVHGALDQGTTRQALAPFHDDSRVAIYEMWEGYSWSSALNLALMAIQIDNRTRQEETREELRFVLNISVETQLAPHHLAAMLSAMDEDPKKALVGSSFEGLKDGMAVNLGTSYRHPRNTGMLIRLEAMGSLWGGFDPRCDNLGGMEDIYFLLRLRTLTDLHFTMLDLRIPLILGAHYDQAAKELREQAAIERIVALWRSLFADGTNERRRIETAIAEMALG